MFVSGLPTVEKPAYKRYGHRADCREDLDSTSILVLLPPVLYRPLPRLVKAVFLFEWPMYAGTAEETSLNRGTAA